MRRENEMSPAKQALYGLLRTIGLMMIVIGVVLITVVMIDFITGCEVLSDSVGAKGVLGPRGLSLLLIGIPILGFGIVTTRSAFTATVYRPAFTKTCGSCKTKNDSEAKFCDQCGTRLD